MQKSLSSITAIVPLDLQFRAKDIITKAKLMAERAYGSALQIVFAHNDRGTKSDLVLKKVMASFGNVTMTSGQFYSGAVNSALLRNIAFSKVKTQYLVLLDVDLWMDFVLLEKYLAFVQVGNMPFAILPCLYLTEKGSKDLLSGKQSISRLKKGYFDFSRREFLHLACPSSIIIMQSSEYEFLRGFDERFSGHGYEDFDFMVRLASLHSLLRPSSDFLYNEVARSPLFSQGFRRELGRLCLVPLLEKDFLFHIYHGKGIESADYYSLRQSNYSMFCELHQGLAVGPDRDGDPTLVTEFVEECIRFQRSINEYSIYFENKPGHIDRYDTFRRRVRFLLK